MSSPQRPLRRRLEREQRAIERRLGAAVAPNPGGPLLQGAPIRYEWDERDRGVVHGGIGMIAGWSMRSAWQARSTPRWRC